MLHTVFWKNLTPHGDDRPSGDLAAAIDEHFGSFDAFRNQLSKSASSVQGSGWGALTWEPLGERLFIEKQIYDHQGNVGQGGAPLLVIDAWNTRTTSSTRTDALSTSPRSGTSSTGPTSPPDSHKHAASYPHCNDGPDQLQARDLRFCRLRRLHALEALRKPIPPARRGNSPE